MDVWKRGLTCLALQFTRSAMPPDVHLTSFYLGVLPDLNSTALAVIEGLGTRLLFVVHDLEIVPGFLLIFSTTGSDLETRPQ